MNLEFCIKQMEDQADMIKALAGKATLEQANWKPDGETWSLLETMNHLYREEVGDFRKHLVNILSQAGKGLTPVGTGQEYDLGELRTTLQGFLDERQSSLAWLRNLGRIDWEFSIELKFVNSSRVFNAGEMLASWVAHDLLHIRQLVELQWAYVTHQAQPHSVEYAGEW